jgi:hypothetical protein
MHNEAVNRLDFITGRTPITVDYEPGTVEIVEQHDGSQIALRKLNAEYNIHDKLAAMSFLLNHAAEGQIVTGLLYVDSDPDDLHSHLATVDAPLNALRRGKELLPRLGDARQGFNAVVWFARLARIPTVQGLPALSRASRHKVHRLIAERHGSRLRPKCLVPSAVSPKPAEASGLGGWCRRIPPPSK